MTDRELLERAARAAGIVILRSRLDDPLMADMLIERRPTAQPCGWNPLTDDGDALRLLMQLRLGIGWIPGGHSVHICCGPQFWSEAFEMEYQPQSIDAATRRAIVRAAAAMEPTP